MTDSHLSNTSFLWVSAGLTVPDNKNPKTASEELAKLRLATIEEAGCYQFEVKPHNDNPRKFTLWEKWTSQGALTQHFQEPHTLQYLSLELTQVDYIEKLGDTL